MPSIVFIRPACLLIAASSLVVCMRPGSAAEPSATPSPVDYDKQIAPLLEKHCVRCHGPKMQDSELRLDTIDNLLIGGKKGPAIEPGKSAQSNVVRAVRGEGRLRMMPPDAPDLKEEEIALLARWIDEGAKPSKKP